jgi:hypothetical protein
MKRHASWRIALRSTPGCIRFEHSVFAESGVLGENGVFRSSGDAALTCAGLARVHRHGRFVRKPTFRPHQSMRKRTAERTLERAKTIRRAKWARSQWFSPPPLRGDRFDGRSPQCYW